MNDVWIAPDRIFDGHSLVSGQAVRLLDGLVTEMAPATPSALPMAGCLTPGFMDLQVNGGGGILLNTTPTRAGMAQIAAAHRRFGTVAIMPTVITDAPEVLERAADAALAAKDDDGIVGLHIEGPHISIARRGTHSARHIRPMSNETIDIVARLRQGGVAVMITVAPEATTNEQIAALSKLGAVVSIGHTDATADVVTSAISAGAVCATHLFNAMSPMTSRAPGAVGAILNSQVRAGVICDGFHVDDRVLQLALRARPAEDLTFLVSDAMATVGGPDTFDLYGEHVHLDGGRLINTEGNLAGAHITQAKGVARLVRHIGLSLEQALRMAITIPAEVVGQPERSGIVGRRQRDLLVLSDAIEVTGTLAEASATRLEPDAAR